MSIEFANESSFVQCSNPFSSGTGATSPTQDQYVDPEFLNKLESQWRNAQHESEEDKMDGLIEIQKLRDKITTLLSKPGTSPGRDVPSARGAASAGGHGAMVGICIPIYVEYD